MLSAALRMLSPAGLIFQGLPSPLVIPGQRDCCLNEQFSRTRISHRNLQDFLFHEAVMPQLDGPSHMWFSQRICHQLSPGRKSARQVGCIPTALMVSQTGTPPNLVESWIYFSLAPIHYACMEGVWSYLLRAWVFPDC